MLRNARAYALSATLLVALVGCGADETPSNSPAAAAPAPQLPTAVPARPTGLGSRMWELSAGTAGSGIMAQLEQFGVRKPTIVFDTDASGASGFAGCNTFQGSYKAGDSAIHLGPFAVTRRACPGMADIETPFLRALAATRSYHVSANSLEFLGEDGTILLSFAPRSN